MYHLEVVRYIILGFAAKEWSSLPKKMYGGHLKRVRAYYVVTYEKGQEMIVYYY